MKSLTVGFADSLFYLQLNFVAFWNCCIFDMHILCHPSEVLQHPLHPSFPQPWTSIKAKTFQDKIQCPMINSINVHIMMQHAIVQQQVMVYWLKFSKNGSHFTVEYFNFSSYDNTREEPWAGEQGDGTIKVWKCEYCLIIILYIVSLP